MKLRFIVLFLGFILTEPSLLWGANSECFDEDLATLRVYSPSSSPTPEEKVTVIENKCTVVLNMDRVRKENLTDFLKSHPSVDCLEIRELRENNVRNLVQSLAELQEEEFEFEFLHTIMVYTQEFIRIQLLNQEYIGDTPVCLASEFSPLCRGGFSIAINPGWFMPQVPEDGIS